MPSGMATSHCAIEVFDDVKMCKSSTPEVKKLRKAVLFFPRTGTSSRSQEAYLMLCSQSLDLYGWLTFRGNVSVSSAFRSVPAPQWPLDESL
ncbi:hypothetical protein ACRRTK_014782 [Alexandromys fortis]